MGTYSIIWPNLAGLAKKPLILQLFQFCLYITPKCHSFKNLFILTTADVGVACRPSL